jgi:hypothetical protein
MCRVMIGLARVGVERLGNHAWLVLLALALQSLGLPPAQAAPAATEPAAPEPTPPRSVTPAPTRPSGPPRPPSSRGQAISEPAVEIWQPETYLAPRRPRRPVSSSPQGTPGRTAPGSPLQQRVPGSFQQRVDPITGVPLGAPAPLDPRLMPMAPAGSPPPVGQLRRRSPFLPGQPMVPLSPGPNPMMPAQPGQPGRAQGALPPGSSVASSKGSAGPWSVLVPLLALSGAVGVFLAERNRRSARQGKGVVRPRINLADRLRPGSGGTRPKDR